jgi:hypothetical protein
VNAVSAHPRVRVAVEAIVVAAALLVLAWAWRADLHWFERHYFLYYWARSPSETRAALGWRIAAVVVGAALLFVVRPLAGRWAGRKSPREALDACGPMTVALLLALVASEVGLRVLRLPRRAHKLGTIEIQIGEPDPRLGWRFLASRATTIEAGGRAIEYAIDADHDRARSIDAAPDLTRPTVLFTGESITAGHGLYWDETFAASTGRALGLQVVDLGVHGYGSDQAFLRLSDALPRFEHPVATVTFFFSLMVWRMTLDDHPHIVFDGVTPRLVSPHGFFHDLHLSQAARGIFEYRDDDALETAKTIFRETARLSTARGAKAIFLCPSFGYAPPRGDRWILDELFADQGLACVDVDIGDETIPGDNHPTARAIAKLTIALTDAMKQVLR